MTPFPSSEPMSPKTMPTWEPVLPPSPAEGSSVGPECCPLCETSKHMKKSKLLYGTPVCKKCYYRFLNRRQAAYLVDVVLFYVLFSIVLGILFAGISFFVVVAKHPLNSSNFQSNSILLAIVSWIMVLIITILFALKDGLPSSSPGKWLLGLKVVDDSTYQPIGFLQSFKRNAFLFLLTFIPYIGGIIQFCCFVYVAWQMRKGPRLGDRWAKTRVVRIKQMGNPVFTGLLICRHCQYDLRGNTSGSCPECGTPLAPQQTEKIAQESLATPSC